MADLSGQTIASSYEQLLSLPDGGGNANTLVAVTDGDGGTTFGIKLATNKVEIIPGSNDTNAFEVSQADGTAVLTVDSTNARVGIGTSSPASTLHVNDGSLRVVGSNERILVIEDGGQNSVELGHSTSSTHDGFIALTDDSGTTQILLTSGTNVSYINNGNVGIGTSSPNELLHVEGSSPSIRIKASNEGGLAELKLQSDQGDDDADLWSLRADPAHEFKIMSNSTGSFSSHAVFRLTETEFAKDVGIGAAPSANLDVRGTSSKPIVNFGDADARDADATDIFGSDSFRYQFQNGTTARPAIIEGGGDIATNESAVYFTGFSSSQADGHRNLGGMIVFRKNTSSTNGNQDGSEIHFRTKANDTATPTQYWSIKSDGTMHSHNSALHITTDGTDDGDYNGAVLSRGVLNLNRDDTSTVKQIKFHKNGSEHSYLETSTDGLEIGGSNVGIGGNPSDKLDIHGGNLRVRVGGAGAIHLQNDGSNHSQILANDNTGTTTVQLKTNGDSFLNGGNFSITKAFPSITLTAGTNESASLRLKNDAQDWDVNCQSVDHFAVFDQTLSAAAFLLTATNYFVSLPGVYSGTTSSAANVHINSGGSLLRVTSAKKYKEDIKDYKVGLDAVNQMNPVSYKSKKDMHNSADEKIDDKTYAGLLADDIHDLGLSEFVEYGEDGEVEGLFYERMVSVCINAIKELSAKVKDLEKKLGE